jgi:hypothetical protein
MEMDYNVVNPERLAILERTNMPAALKDRVSRGMIVIDQTVFNQLEILPVKLSI